MSGLPERSVVAYYCYAERAKWNTLMVGMSAKQVLAEQQLKGAELKVENTELSCGGMQRTTVNVAIRYFGGAATVVYTLLVDESRSAGRRPSVRTAPMNVRVDQYWLPSEGCGTRCAFELSTAGPTATERKKRVGGSRLQLAKRRVARRSAAGPPALSLPALFPTLLDNGLRAPTFRKMSCSLSALPTGATLYAYLNRFLRKMR
ncbi:hypothetical protein ALC57_09158 [Trachymyrmex cornetzi]|uniref:Uncharacterized protein n=1 Tax=Trachymyrmex cornetzi TaxID=471704 RepID=A0A195E031_9HYME|nr:hypothetical protein ALC57_09158 [Trachymyrmex cornetzi]